MRSVIALFVLCLVPLAGIAQTAPPPMQKAVLVTGASTGIGRKITEHLADKGYFVYAGARKSEDLESLGKIKNVQAVKLDVTKPEDIKAAVEAITKAGRGLYGLVNNAGIATIGGLLETKPEEYELLMAVNVDGPWNVSRAFAPLIIEQKGRITTIGSISGILAGNDFTAYAMSKHAIEGFTDSVALKLAPLGVKVTVVEPGNFASEIGNNAAKRAGQETRLGNRNQLKQPDDVAAAVELALFDAEPKRRYLVVPHQGEAERTIKKQIEQLVQLNEGHAYTYSRDELVKMLDVAMATARPRTTTPAAPGAK
jgi:NAD(P)-dependent dehydrogenase (short-subunit alcohol dehydrogenase family)